MSGSIDDARLNLVRAKANDWAASLIDLGHRNTLLHFRDTKTASLDLSAASPHQLRLLLTGSSVNLRGLFGEPDDHRDACTRARNLKRRIVALEEEQGIQAGRIAHGLIKVSAQSRGAARVASSLRAPLLLRAVEIQAKTVSESDYSLRAGDEVEVNPVLLYALVSEHGAELDLDVFTDELNGALAANEDPAEQLEAVFARLQSVLGAQDIVADLEARVTIGLFSYEKLPMVQDLQRSTELLAQNAVIAALAGDKGAEQELLVEGRSASAVDIDRIEPMDEVLVQDADSSQELAIAAALAGQNVLIEGPPGTGKSQTIANIIAAAAWRGLKVLFVAEKRAAIEAVTQRLADVDLDNLVLDLHQQKLNKRQLAQQLTQSLDRAATELPVQIEGLASEYAGRRSRIIAYSDELHSVRQPWGMSAYQVLEASFTIEQGAETRIRFRSRDLRALDGETVKAVTQELRDFVDSGGARVFRGESPWSHATVRTNDDIRTVLAELDELNGSTLRRSTDDMEWLLRETGLAKPTSIAEWEEVLDLLGGISEAVSEFGEDIFQEDLDSLYLATADRAVRKAEGVRMPFGMRRKLIKAVRVRSRRGITKRRDLNREILLLRSRRDLWLRLSTDQRAPMSVHGLADITTHYRTLRTQLAAVALCTRLDDLEQRPAEHVGNTLDELDEDRDTLWQMPKLTGLKQKFGQLGLSRLLDEIIQSDADADQAAATLRFAWIRSLMDEFKLESQALRDFVAKNHSRSVAEFGAMDVSLRDAAPRRIRREVARRLSGACDAYPEQSQTVRKQAARKTGHMPLRRLVETAPDVLLAVRPCWAMSPLLVSKTLPAACLFDIVIFDEASQILPQDAVTSIVRGRKIVVAGDDRQLPPSMYFQRMLSGTEDDDEEDDAGDLGKYESILARLSSLLTDRHMLKWHYRSRDERLISFSNKEIYGGELVTFPGTLEGPPITLDLVNGIAQPGQDGSAPAEVAKVVERIVEHAQQRPDESLGVIAMSQRHADRIEMALRAALRERPEIEGFFGDNGGASRRFFIKNLERVQGDERDSIILSVGYPRRADGRVSRNFGPLNQEGGQRRLNVAVTRAKRRMTVVSSFSAADLEPRLDPTGAELLRRFLDFAEHGGDLAKVGRLFETGLNGFEDGVRRALIESEVPVYPQWGFSEGYRIDFALGDPDQPGRLVLALETDGERYHHAHSARDRDRLRQSHLENLGWRFHRLWSTAWFTDPDGELERILEAWRIALKEPASATETVDPAAVEGSHESIGTDGPAPIEVRQAPKPRIRPGYKISEYTDRELTALFRWLLSDELYLTKDARLEQGLRELGFQRRGKVIVDRLTRALETVMAEKGGSK
ncbi:AAA domain-containing protein [Kribbella sp. NPDC059898]|uniref:AAA domain-containing protein n=1 Tax=Kribbella sp. NPDC059898 TaxID=3346995 RepID=UPI003651806A